MVVKEEGHEVLPYLVIRWATDLLTEIGGKTGWPDITMYPRSTSCSGFRVRVRVCCVVESSTLT